jgi:hypothetical protein
MGARDHLHTNASTSLWRCVALLSALALSQAAASNDPEFFMIHMSSGCPPTGTHLQGVGISVTHGRYLSVCRNGDVSFEFPRTDAHYAESLDRLLETEALTMRFIFGNRMGQLLKKDDHELSCKVVTILEDGNKLVDLPANCLKMWNNLLRDLRAFDDDSTEHEDKHFLVPTSKHLYRAFVNECDMAPSMAEKLSSRIAEKAGARMLARGLDLLLVLALADVCEGCAVCTMSAELHKDCASQQLFQASEFPGSYIRDKMRRG